MGDGVGEGNVALGAVDGALDVGGGGGARACGGVDRGEEVSAGRRRGIEVLGRGTPLLLKVLVGVERGRGTVEVGGARSRVVVRVGVGRSCFDGRSEAMLVVPGVGQCAVTGEVAGVVVGVGRAGNGGRGVGVGVVGACVGVGTNVALCGDVPYRVVGVGLRVVAACRLSQRGTGETIEIVVGDVVVPAAVVWELSTILVMFPTASYV